MKRLNNYYLRVAGEPNLFIFCFLAAGAALVCRIILVWHYGSEVPYWDQWDAEAWTLYKPWLEGSLGPFDLLAPHNEHRIFTTRVWNLAMLVLNDQVWSPKFQMYANQTIFFAASLIFLRFVWPKASGKPSWVFLFPAAYLLSIPFSWANIMSGFQSSFYFMMLFSLAGLSFMTPRSGASSFVLGLSSLSLAFLSLAGGVVAAITVLLGILIRSACERRFTSHDIMTLVVTLWITMVAFFATPSIEGHAGLRAQNLSEFAASVLSGLSWPAPPEFNFYGLPLWISFLPWTFFSCAAVQKSWRRCEFPRGDLLIVLIGAWVVGQIVLLAIGRSEGLLSSRYLDTFTYGLILNVALCIRAFPVMKVHVKYATCIWVAALMISTLLRVPTTLHQIAVRHSAQEEHEARVLAYLCARDPASILEAPHFTIPYPSGNRLKRFLDAPSIVGLLKFVPDDCK